MAGYETTAASLNYTIYALAHNKEAQDELRAEIMNFSSSDSSGNDPTYEDFLTKMPFLDAVCKEAYVLLLFLPNWVLILRVFPFL